MGFRRKRKNTIKKRKKRKKSYQKKRRSMTKAGMKLPGPRKSITKSKKTPLEEPEPEPEPDPEPIISLDSRTEFDGRESWEKDREDRGILKLYNVYNDGITLKLELKEVNEEDGSEISRCNAQIDSIKLKYDFLSQIRSTDSTKRGYGTNLLYLLAKARHEKKSHNGINYNEITIRDFLPEIFNPFRNLFQLSFTLWPKKFKISSPQFTLFEPFYGEEPADVVNILYNHNISEEDILECGEELAKKYIDTRFVDDKTELLEGHKSGIALLAMCASHL